jgi:hypothetical protein
MSVSIDKARPVNSSEFADHPPALPLRLVFIHHSCGGQWLAEPGPEQGENCIYRTHPNGGGLRALLEKNSYVVHEASYGSRIGQDTDVFHWLPKFRGRMEEILACENQDSKLNGCSRNNIVVFKSCFPNNAFKSAGTPPGDPRGPELTVWNAKAAYHALLEEFRKYPKILFVCVTAPPLALNSSPQPAWKQLVKQILGRNHPFAASAPLAREFNRWLSADGGWLQNYPAANAAVFDYYDILTGHGKSDLSVYPTGGGSDSHPSQEGNQKAAAAFLPFLNRAVHRAGLIQSTQAINQQPQTANLG